MFSARRFLISWTLLISTYLLDDKLFTEAAPSYIKPLINQLTLDKVISAAPGPPTDNKLVVPIARLLDQDSFVRQLVHQMQLNTMMNPFGGMPAQQPMQRGFNGGPPSQGLAQPQSMMIGPMSSGPSWNMAQGMGGMGGMGGLGGLGLLSLQMGLSKMLE